MTRWAKWFKCHGMASPRHEAILDLLMGAAFADKTLDGREVEKVKSLMCSAMRAKELPASLERRMARFDPKKFNLRQCVATLVLATDDEKRKVLEFIAAVHDADELLDMDEDAYLRHVAREMLLDESAVLGLTVDVLSIESLGPEVLPPPLDGRSIDEAPAGDDSVDDLTLAE
ncbi:MAG: hypothetical protein EXR75_05470 [Myxococcales bacterium]|nr:hypothetical protein [Myxococcales bacterium]